MPWVRVDDHFDEHPKLAEVGVFGLALWVCGLAYCNRNLTDGFIPITVARTLVDFTAYTFEGYPPGSHGDVGWTARLVAEDLVHANLWEPVDGGFHVHDYEVYQPTKSQIIAERAVKAAAGRAGGLATATARGQATAVAGDQAKSKPVPKPVPVPTSVSDPLALTGENVAREGFEEPEGEALTWLARHGCDIRPGNGYHQKLVLAVENHGINAVVGMFDRLEGAGVKKGDIKGYLFGAIDALNGKPDLKALDREERVEDERARHARQLAATQRLLAEQRGERPVSS